MSARLLVPDLCAICWRPLDLEAAFRVLVCVCVCFFFFAVKMVDKFFWTQLAFVVVIVEICVSFITKCPAVRLSRKIALPAEQKWADC